MSIADLASATAAAFAHPIAIVALIVVSTAWALSRAKNNTLTMILSILAITMTQLVLLDGARTDLATQAKLDALLTTCGAGAALVRAEDKSPETIEELRQ